MTRKMTANSVATMIVLGCLATPALAGEPVADTTTVVYDNQSSSGISALPPIESIGPGSDISSFLTAGVPEDLTRAALRRAWVTDPKIRDFVGLSEGPSSAFDHPPQILRAEPQLSHAGSQ